MSARGRAQDAALRAGWVIGRRIPRRAVAPLAGVAARVAAAAGFVDMSGWRANARRVLGAEPDAAQTRAALAHYARYFLEMLTLSGWTREELGRTIGIRPEVYAALRADLEGPGAVLALGHLGNWDLAGAWACQYALPVSSVAEQLPGDAFARFLAHRESLGFRIYGHRDPGVVGRLIDDAAAHRLVCLLADRDLRGRGLPVAWPLRSGSAPVTLPVGPVLVAQRSGAVLRALALRYAGPTMIMDFSDPIPVGPGREGLVTAAQAVADHLGAAVAREVAQWHVLQPFFGAER